MIAECLVVEFSVTGDECPLSDAAAAVDATIDATPPLLRHDGFSLLRFSTTEERIGGVLDSDERIRYLHRTGARDGRYTFRCLSKAPCIVHELIDHGFLVESIRYQPGEERLTGAVVGTAVLKEVLEAAGERVGVELEGVSPLGDDGRQGIAGRWNLTPAQADALAAAYRLGYFEIPKETTAAAVAAELDISKSAFLERLRRGQSAILDNIIG